MRRSSAKCWNTMPMLWRRISIIRGIAGGEQILAVEQDLAGGRFDEARQAARSVDFPRPRQAL
ncbi:MAG: hypothetical protein HPM95_07530 [Alphaproteobacteria bacterium]|nr:hypothetical protein [Alphaproteobacteria bacterium]